MSQSNEFKLSGDNGDRSQKRKRNVQCDGDWISASPSNCEITDFANCAAHRGLAPLRSAHDFSRRVKADARVPASTSSNSLFFLVSKERVKMAAKGECAFAKRRASLCLFAAFRCTRVFLLVYFLFISVCSSIIEVSDWPLECSGRTFAPPVDLRADKSTILQYFHAYFLYFMPHVPFLVESRVLRAVKPAPRTHRLYLLHVLNISSIGAFVASLAIVGVSIILRYVA